MKFCQALNGSLNIERDRVHYCYVVKQHMPTIPWNPEEELPIERIQIVRKALIKHLNEDMDQNVPEYEEFGECSTGFHPCKGCRMICDIDDNAQIPSPDQLSYYLHMQAFTYCNAKCIYCHLSHDAGRTPINKGRDLDQAVYKAVNLLFDKNMVNPDCRVIFSSGEPTLSKFGMTTLNRLVEKGQDTLVNTNAICFSPELEKAMREGNTDVQVSLDSGDRESYIDIKGVDKFDAVAENIDRYVTVSSERSRFWLKYIVYSKTNSKETLDKFVDFCSKHHIRNVVVNMNYNEGEAVSCNTRENTVETQGEEVADIETLSAYGYLAAKLDLRGFRVAKEISHLTTHEQELAEGEYAKAMQVQLSPVSVLVDEKQSKSITIMNLTPYGDAIQDFSWSEKNPIGDSETATINMAAALKKRGHEVKVVTDREGLMGHRCDIFIANHEWDIFQEGILPGKLNYLWCHDDVNKGKTSLLRNPTAAEDFYNACDGVIFSSHYQQERWLKALNIPLNKAFMSSNGVPLDKFDVLPDSLGNRQPWAYYSTTSRQDLVVLLKGWPLIKSAVPDAELHLYSSMAIHDNSEKESFRQLYRLALNLDGVTFYGLVGQAQIRKAAQMCRVLASPCVFPKTSCIIELEAMAAGSVVVSMALGALPETAWHNPLVPMTDGWLNQWVLEVVRVLVDDQHYQRLARQNLNAVSHFAWDTVATGWLERFRLDLAGKQKKEVHRKDEPIIETSESFFPNMSWHTAEHIILQ